MVQKIIKALILAVVFTALGYVIFKDLGTALVCGLIMFMSMFVKKKDY